MATYPHVDPYYSNKFQREPVEAKVVVLGNTGVGKTSLVQRYVEDRFSPNTTTSTTGAFFLTKKLEVDGTKVRLQLWDTAGQERFRSMAPMYYRGAQAALLVYSIVEESSFDAIKGWLEELRRNTSSDLIVYIVGSKADLSQHRAVTVKHARHCLRTWFPPPRPPSPPAPSPLTTLSYIRPRLPHLSTSISVPHIVSRPLPTPHQSRLLPSSNTAVSFVKTTAHQSHSQSRRRNLNGVREPVSDDDDDDPGTGTGTNGSSDGDGSFTGDEMCLFEISSKDDQGISNLFNTLISTIIERRDAIERQKALRKRDSVFLTPTWDAVAAEEERERELERAAAASWTCC